MRREHLVAVIASFAVSITGSALAQPAAPLPVTSCREQPIKIAASATIANSMGPKAPAASWTPAVIMIRSDGIGTGMPTSLRSITTKRAMSPDPASKLPTSTSPPIDSGSANELRGAF